MLGERGRCNKILKGDIFAILLGGAMDVQRAVRLAKDYVHELYADEGITNLGLEEVKLDEDVWRITIGFSRPWDAPSGFMPSSLSTASRSLKIVNIDDRTGDVISMETRDARQLAR